MEGLRGYTSGLAIPTYVIDLPFGGGKVPLQANYVVAKNENELILKNYQGRLFRFRNPGNISMETQPISDISPVEETNHIDADLEKVPVPVVRR
jgi:hypothetical protein